MRTVIILLLTAAVAPAADPPKAKLAELVKLYKAYELPPPPTDAKLYREAFKEGGRGGPPPPPRIGFGLKPDKDGVSTEFLVGCVTDRFSAEFTTEIPPEIKHIAADQIHLTTVVQFHLRGWTDLAEAAFTRGGHWKDKPELALAGPAWRYWLNKLHDPAVDRALILRRMASAQQAYPDGFRDDESEMLYVDLRKSLLPSRAKPGTVEALIDEWLDITEFFTPTPSDERYEAVVRQGFDAVPALIDALTDTRLSRGSRSTFGGLGSGPVRYRIRDYAEDILRGFMYEGERFAEEEEGIGLDIEAVRKWWATVSKANEEEYVVSRVLKVAEGEYLPNEHLLTVIRHKYPKRLPTLFRKVLTDHPDRDIHSVAYAVATSTLPKETKRELLLEAVASKDLYRQLYGRMFLYDVDPERFHQIVIDELSKLPNTPNEPYHVCREAAFAQDVLRTDDAKVWAAAEKYVRRADAGIRLEWLREFARSGQPPEVRRRCAEFVAQYLTDTAVRDATAEPKLYPGGYAGYPDFKVIEVRNYAAYSLSYMLEVKGKPTAKWSADEWAKFRDEVAKAVKSAK
ncbi:MAG: hypothetical protein ABGY75_05345 [Gemmataceae bacterium]